MALQEYIRPMLLVTGILSIYTLALSSCDRAAPPFGPYLPSKVSSRCGGVVLLRQSRCWECQSLEATKMGGPLLVGFVCVYSLPRLQARLFIISKQERMR